MKKRILYLILLAFLFLNTSCREDSILRDRHVCDCEQRKEVAKFVKEGIKDGNNMSDEEMEDVIKQLRITAIIIYCPQKQVWVHTPNENLDTTKTKLDSCESIMRMH